MNAIEFVKKWSQVALNEKASYQSFMDDLCHVVGHQTPAEYDPNGIFFRYEKYVDKTFSGKGFADVWYKGHFAWEHKSRGKDGENLLRESVAKVYATIFEFSYFWSLIQNVLSSTR